MGGLLISNVPSIRPKRRSALAAEFVGRFCWCTAGRTGTQQESPVLALHSFPGRMKKVSLHSLYSGHHVSPLKKGYFWIYHPVMVSSSTFSEVFFVTMLTTIIAMSEMTKA